MQRSGVILQHPWQQWADLILNSAGVESATARGFTVRLADGSREVEFDGGLTEEHFSYFARLLDDWEQTLLARAVLDNLMCLNSWPDWDTAWWLLRQRY